MSDVYVLTLSCVDRPGIVAAMVGLLAARRGNILESQQFDDLESGRFFMRVVFDMPGQDAETVRALIAPVVRDFSMDARVRRQGTPMKVMLLVSKFDHCLSDLLYRVRIGEW